MENDIEKTKTVIILLHEIYGVNQFIKEQHKRFSAAGFDVVCPDLLGRAPFLYDESEVAYTFFMQNVGFEISDQIGSLITQLKRQYDNVFLVGFSVGATIAWKCSENNLCSGIIACYGSRIRDYADVCPVCPTLLMFAQEDGFDVSAICSKLREKQNISLKEFEANHGFLNPYSKEYDLEQATIAQKLIRDFLNTYKK